MNILLANVVIVYSLVYVALHVTVDGLQINGNNPNGPFLYSNVGTLCEYFEGIDTALTETEKSRDPSRVAWIYGYLSAIFSRENEQLKAIIEMYTQGQMETDLSKAIFNCLERFTEKLSLNKYVSEHPKIDPDQKKQYLIVSEDIRSVMESGVAFAFYSYSKEHPESLLERFLQIYKTRERLSDPINRIFNLLTSDNCTADGCFLTQVITWSQCDSSFNHFTKTLKFFNSIQRFLISGLFIEDFHLIINFASINGSGQWQRYREQMGLHRTQYRNISYRLMDTIHNCHRTLSKVQQHQLYKMAYHSFSATLSFKGPFYASTALLTVSIIFVFH